MTWANGNRFEGNWENDKPHGHGTFEWADGQKYIGEWVDG